MGYYTRYSLKWEIKIADYNGYLDTEIGDAIENSGGFENALNRDGSTNERATWYGHVDEMKAFSKKFPSVLFTLSGDGEVSIDLWKKYFLNGKVQIVKALLDFPKFDAKLLK